MSTKTTVKKSLLICKPTAKTSSFFAAAIVSSALLAGLTVTTMPTQAASLGDLFGNNQGATQPKFLSVDKAFQVGATTKAVANGTRLAINFDITPKHYVYKDRITLDLPAGVTAAPFVFSQRANMIDDPTFGRVPVFDQTNVVATTTLTSSKAINNAALTIGWQGCAKAGLCYPPEKIKTTVTIAPVAQKTATANAINAANTTSSAAKINSTEVSANSASKNAGSTSEVNTISGAATNTAGDNALVSNDSLKNADLESNNLESTDLENSTTEDAEETVPDSEATNSISGADSNSISGADSNTISGADNIDGDIGGSGNRVAANGLEESDPFGLASHPWLALGLLFLAGLGLALTPCVLPMLPIVANIVARQQNPTVKKGVILTTSYAVGVSIAYGILGAVIAVFGESLGIIGWLQNPIILIGFAIVFVLLALYMLEVFTIRLPHKIASKMQGLSQAGDSKLGSAGGSLAAGFLSALVVSPCVSAPLFGALLAVSTIGNPVLGFAALFMLGFGLSAPLILIGATQGKIMPKAGEWMNWVKQGFALLLFAVALLLIERVFVSPVMLMVWALWFMVVAMWAWRWLGRGRMLTQALALVMGIWAACLILGAALGNDDSLHPLESLSAAPIIAQTIDGQPAGNNVSNNATDTKITTLAELDAITAANPKVLVDVTADWCIECRIMDKNLFTNRPAQMADWQLVRLDITETSADSKAILARYQLFGPPTLLYYQDGELVNKQVGEVGRQEFEDTLTMLNK